MYTVLIVDDEPVLRMGLSKMISWEEEGFKIIGSVMNGKSALAFLEENPVDLVITDMKMPIMDGLELVQTLQKRKFPGCYLVLTNYSDFDLARESFRGGAVDYILKATLNAEELIVCLKKVTEKLDQQKDQRIETKKDRITEDEQNILDWMEGKNCEKETLSVHFHGLCLIQSKMTQEVFQNYAEELLKTNLLLNRRMALKTKEKFVFCFYEGDGTEGTQPYIVGERLVTLMNTYHNITSVVLIKKNVVNKREVDSFILKCYEHKDLIFYAGIRNTFSLKEYGKKEKIRLDKEEMIEEYQRGVKAYEFEKAKEQLIASVTAAFGQEISPAYARTSLKGIIESIMIEYSPYFEENRDAWEETERFLKESESFSDYIKTINIFNYHLEHLFMKYKKEQYREEIIAIMDYVEKNLSKKISLGAISKVVNMNESYISRLFKQETSMSLMGYVNMLKIEKAMELLKDPNLKVKDIVDLVGFEQQSYFNKIFNKYCNMNPLDYKKMLENH